MIEATILHRKLDEVREHLRECLRRRLAARLFLFFGLAAGGLTLCIPLLGREVRLFAPALLVLFSFSALILNLWIKRRRWSDLEVARMIEQRHPDLNALLITAVEHLEPGAELPEFFQKRLLTEAASKGAVQAWPTTVTSRALRRATVAFVLAALLCASAWVWLLALLPRSFTPEMAVSEKALPVEKMPESAPKIEITVSPGDTEIEQGSRLIVEAKMQPVVPDSATLILSDLEGKELDRVPMRLTVDGDAFGGLLTRVKQDALYRVEAGEAVSKTHKISTFVYPALVRADVKITPPAYSGLPAKEIKNTMKATVLEGGEIEFTLTVNKPVKDAELFGQDKTSLPFKPKAGEPTVLTAVMKPEKSQKWRLHLVDEQERANKNPPWFTVTVQTNQLAKIEVVFPKRDIQVSAIQELPVEAKVSDDIGVTRSGVLFSIAGDSKEVLFQHGVTAPAKKQDVKTLLTLENENAEPRQLVSYFFWAEDQGPQGEVRRAMSDMFFADVRHFEDIFREREAPPSMPGEPGQQAQSDKLLDLQKQVVNATWRVIRDTNAGKSMDAAAPDVDVVRESQGITLDKTKEAMEEAEDAEVKLALTEAWKSMKDALDPLQQAAGEKKRTALNQALGFEQSALEWLHRASSREHLIMRQNQPRQPGQGQRPNENQLSSLELKQEEQRYEEEKMAAEEQSAEQQENLQVLNRLKELARRQEALAEKMKELENQIAQAKTEEEREELENQLKRLQQEQEQLLSDLDDLKERMEKPENASNMAEAREQLDQVREQVMDSAEKLREQQLADAANSATRAQRELEQMQEDFKQKTAQRFSEEMKQLRQQAREVAEQQKQISEALENQKTPDPGQSTSALEKMLDGSQVARKIEEQSGKVNELLENMRRISEQAEGNNPLLHRRLYESVRDAQTSGLEENLEEARLQSRYGQRAEAQDAERKAAAAVEKLQQGVDKAAESVLGSETDALRMARSELDKLIKEAESEAGQAAGASENPQGVPGSDAAAERQTAQAGKKPGEMEGGEKSGTDAPPSQTGAESDPKGQARGPGQPSEDGEEKQPGRGQQTAQAGQQPGKESEGQGSQPGGQRASPKGEPQTAQAGGQTGEENTPGQQPGEGSQPGEEGRQQGQGGRQPGQTAQSGQSEPSSQPGQSGQPGQARQSGQPRPNTQAGTETNRAGSTGGGGREGGLLFFEEADEQPRQGPITGEGYDRWSDRLRNVEEMLSQPELRNEAARVLDDARAMRIEHERNDAPPQVDHLAMRIIEPLVELRDRVAEELAKREAGNNTVPVDRDPVPPAFRDLVRRYYKELGGGE